MCRALRAARNLQLVANGLCGGSKMSLGCAGRSLTGMDLKASSEEDFSVHCGVAANTSLFACQLV
jgi:hypothetical protein